jgi:hypothetical protein
MKAFDGVTIRVCIIVAVVLVAVGVTAALAQDPATNKPAAQSTFRTPLVRDLELVDQVKGLAAKVAALEAKNAEMAKKIADLESKLAAVRR